MKKKGALSKNLLSNELYHCYSCSRHLFLDESNNGISNQTWRHSKKNNYNFENLGVFNPAVIREGPIVNLFYRAVREGNVSTIGYCKLHGPLTVTERYTTPIFYQKIPKKFKG